MRRYFLVHYQAVTPENHIFMGMLSIMMEDGAFINRKHTERLIKEGASGQDFSKANVVISNIMELSEEDYLDWYE